MAAPFVVRLRAHGGVAVECLHVPPASPSRLHLVVLPGNPGGVAFYAAYVDSVQRAAAAAGVRLHVWVVGHSGHCAATATAARFSLAQQLAHKRAVVDAILRAQPGARLVLAGHSVGAHIALELLRTLPPRAVLRAVLLTPTLSHIGRAPNGVRLKPVLSSALFRWGAWAGLHALGALPAPLQRLLLRTAVPQAADAGVMRALLSLRHPHVPLQAAHMALDEFEAIGPLDGAHVAAHAPKLALYFTPGDGWVADSDAGAMAARLAAAPPGGLVHRCADGHSHSFVLCPAASARVGALTWRWIAAACTGAAAEEGGEEDDDLAAVAADGAGARRPQRPQRPRRGSVSSRRPARRPSRASLLEEPAAVAAVEGLPVFA